MGSRNINHQAPFRIAAKQAGSLECVFLAYIRLFGLIGDIKETDCTNFCALFRAPALEMLEMNVKMEHDISSSSDYSPSALMFPIISTLCLSYGYLDIHNFLHEFNFPNLVHLDVSGDVHFRNHAPKTGFQPRLVLESLEILTVRESVRICNIIHAPKLRRFDARSGSRSWDELVRPPTLDKKLLALVSIRPSIFNVTELLVHSRCVTSESLGLFKHLTRLDCTLSFGSSRDDQHHVDVLNTLRTPQAPSSGKTKTFFHNNNRQHIPSLLLPSLATLSFRHQTNGTAEPLTSAFVETLKLVVDERRESIKVLELVNLRSHDNAWFKNNVSKYIVKTEMDGYRGYRVGRS